MPRSRGITTTIVNPGFFRTELLTEQSTNYAEPSIKDYDERRAKQLEFWKARALLTIASLERPPRASSPAPMPLPPPNRLLPT